MTPAQKEFKKGVDHYLAERLSSAERCLRKVVRQTPDHGDALHLLGLIAVRSDQAKAGERRIRQAIATAPGNHVYHGSLGAALRAQGRPEEALAAYGTALEQSPDYAVAWQNTAQIKADLGRLDEAVTAYRRAIELEGRDAVAHFGLANALGERDDMIGAETHYRSALEIDETYVEAWNNLGNLLAATGRLSFAVGALKEAIKHRPGDAALPLNLAGKLEAGGRLEEARTAYLEALALDPENLSGLAGLAALTAFMGDDAGAKTLFDQLLELDPGTPRTHTGIATWHEIAGRKEEARTAAQQALTLAPDNTEAALLLAQLDRREGDLESARGRLETLDARLDENDEDGNVAFELGRVLDRLGEHEAAFEAFGRGNAALDRDRNAGRYDGSKYLRLIADIRTSVTEKSVAGWSDMAPDDGLPDPVFFVGFPRSGTTLMEQILDAHDDVISVEEQPLLEAARLHLDKASATAYPTGLADLPPETISGARQAWWQAAREHVGDLAEGVQLVDKLPLNIVHLGLVRRLFPGAKILVALRDPRDVVLSCFMQSFRPNDAMVHFRDLEAAANLYVEVMTNWRQQSAFLELDCFDYRYENLVADPGSVARDVLKFLGLPWQEDVLDYHTRSRERLVKTPSYQDVREAVYSRAVKRWQHYATNLAPVQDRLAPFVKAFGYED
jgi:tetratricopeptide (TPR) repeat protein